MSDKGSEQTSKSRREFLKKAAYLPPAIATISISPSVFASGSGYRRCGSRDGRYGSRDGRYGSSNVKYSRRRFGRRS